MLYNFTGCYSISYGPFHQFCNATSSSTTNECHLYLKESVTFLCPCNRTGCIVFWSVTNDSGQEYNIANVTYSDEGEISCTNDVHEKYIWNVTVSQSSKPCT